MRSKYLFLLVCTVICACKAKIKINTDEVYSRHLQKHINITAVSTPAPANRSDFNLLLINDGAAMKAAGIEKIIDSLWKKKALHPLIVVGIEPFDARGQYGVSDFPSPDSRGALAKKYADFVVNELLPFIKNKTKARSFQSVSIAGAGWAGISALDIAWDNWQKFDRVAFLPPMAAGDTGTDFSALVKKIKQSRKRPKLLYWVSQSDDLKNPSRSDSVRVQRFFDILKDKGYDQGLTIAGTEDDKNRVIPFKDSFIQFLLWAGY